MSFLDSLESKSKKFYDERQKYTNIETLAKVKKSIIKVDKNDSAEIFRFKDFNIVEFNTKANTLDYNSMDSLMKATDKPLIIINESIINITFLSTLRAENNDLFKSDHV